MQTQKTQVFEHIDAYRRWRHSLSSDGQKPLVGFVPTMGALHSGHIHLVEQARQRCEKVVVSIFVNPLQFGPNEDFDRYPRTFPNDLKLCELAGVDCVLHPAVSEIYPQPLAETTKVVPPQALINGLCGAFRPGHFEGVATVVMKLFGIVEPTVAFFGEKDYQQLAVIKRMVRDLNFPVEVVGIATVREKDGLALSSRNVYLTAEERQLAPLLNQCLVQIRDRALNAREDLTAVLEQAKQRLSAVPGLAVQYLEACDVDTLMPLSAAQRPMVILVAAKLGNVRLIDNLICR